MRTVLLLAGCSAVCLILPACSESPKLLRVKGTVVHNGAPLKAENGSIQIVFIPVVEDKTPHDSYPATFKRDDSSFTVPGRTGNGIAPGKYRISVTRMVPNPTEEVMESNATFSAKDSPIVRDISTEAPLAIDLANP